MPIGTATLMRIEDEDPAGASRESPGARISRYAGVEVIDYESGCFAGRSPSTSGGRAAGNDRRASRAGAACAAVIRPTMDAQAG